MTSLRVVVVGATGNVGTSVFGRSCADPAVDVGSSASHAARRRLGRPRPRRGARPTSCRRRSPRFRGADVVVHLGWLIQPSRDGLSPPAVNVDGSAAGVRRRRPGGREIDRLRIFGRRVLVGPKDRAVDETWATDGMQTSFYSRHKVQVEPGLDASSVPIPTCAWCGCAPG